MVILLRCLGGWGASIGMGGARSSVDICRALYITVGHWPISAQLTKLTTQNIVWSALLSEQC